ncbi:hypothetical protein [Amycolatopsis sp. CA-126428]|uniref:hypothetical protein n=1 Tax=Amycolatopsis sp. CA-126428 TaxID=2073158 RepID=UPI000CD1139A|nr:hypothetical protein [Amycolatopsis sp. CA-126428]
MVRTSSAVAAPAVADAADSCSAYTNRAVLGGYEQTLTCVGSSFRVVAGLGTTLTDAATEATALVQDPAIAASKRSFYNGSSAVLGGFSVTLQCTAPAGLYFVTGTGTKLTDAAASARALIHF